MMLVSRTSMCCGCGSLSKDGEGLFLSLSSLTVVTARNVLRINLTK